MDLEKLLAQVEKTLSTQVGGADRTTLVRENLSGVISSLVDKETNVRDRLTRKPGSGLAAAWNVLSAITTGDSAFTEGGVPTEDDATYALRTAVYKELGKKKSITDRMIAAGKTFGDVEAEQTEVALREVIQDEEQYIITGDAVGHPLQFSGLATLIGAGTDDNNDALGFRTDLWDKEITGLMRDHAVRPTALYVGHGLKRCINQSLAGEVRVNLDATNQVSTGVEVNFAQTAAGKLPIISTFAIASSAMGANLVEDFYVVTEKYKGQDNLYMEDLYDLGKVPLARVGAAISFMITESTVLVCRAKEFNARVQNVRVQ
jgi:hypothetical protein